MNKIWADEAWNEYLEWNKQDKKILKRINELIKNIEKNGNSGIGKLEPLKYQLSGYWSRRINHEHRLIYKLENDTIKIISCKSHYKK